MRRRVPSRLALAALALTASPPPVRGEAAGTPPAGPVLQTVDAANTRYSPLDAITAGNVGRLQVAWTFSTGILRGHEGAPLVVILHGCTQNAAVYDRGSGWSALADRHVVNLGGGRREPSCPSAFPGR